jgi:hypothetical protein
MLQRQICSKLRITDVVEAIISHERAANIKLTQINASLQQSLYRKIGEDRWNTQHAESGWPNAGVDSISHKKSAEEVIEL